MKKRFYCAALILPLTLSLTLSMLASCAKTSVDPGDTGESDTGTVSETASVSEAAETELTDSLGEYDFEGKAYNVVYCEGFFFAPYDVEEENGELLNDAAYKRSRDVEERFNMTAEYTVLSGSAAEATDAVIKTVSAGDDAYSLGIVHPYISLTKLLSGNYVDDWNDIPAVDFSKPWWNASFIDQLSIGEKLPCASSDYIYFNSNAFYFNKLILESFQLENPYELVYSGAWTWDKMAEMSKAVSLDLNGDGALDANDQYGYSISAGHRMVPITYSCGIMSSSLDSDGYPTLENINSDKMQSIVDMYYNILYENAGTYIYKEGNELELFRNGQVLFLNYVTQNIKALRDVEFDYGLLPQPKYDEEQDKYYSLSQSNVMVVPSTVADTEFTGVITEAMSYLSYRDVIPALYEVTFENKYLRDDDSYAMFNIVKNSLVYDRLWNYAEGDSMVYFFTNLMKGKSTDLASFYAKNAGKTEASMRAFFDSVAG